MTHCKDPVLDPLHIHVHVRMSRMSKGEITMLSFRGDGDSCLMKGMQISVGLYCSKQCIAIVDDGN